MIKDGINVQPMILLRRFPRSGEATSSIDGFSLGLCQYSFYKKSATIDSSHLAHSRTKGGHPPAIRAKLAAGLTAMLVFILW
jgi:hypothetical protein